MKSMYQTAFVFLLTALLLLLGVSIFAQSIERDVVASSGDYYESGGISLSWTLGEIATETYISGDNILTQGFQQPDATQRIYVELTLLLEGPFNITTNMMDLNLYNGGHLPLGQPYNPPLPYYNNPTPVWLYAGIENVGAIPPNIVDWVIIQLRDATSPANATSATILDTQAAFILDDGSVVGLDGSSTLLFDVSFVNHLYAVAYHRSHLGVISNFPLSLSGEVYTYDFSSGEMQVYGGASGHKEVKPGVWAMIAADGDADGKILPSDETNVWVLDVNNSGYLGGDFDMNGLGQPQDKTGYWIQNANKAGQVPSMGENIGYESQIPD
jgi:hypothetical protein